MDIARTPSDSTAAPGAEPGSRAVVTAPNARSPFAAVLDPLTADGRVVAVEDRPGVAGRTARLRQPLDDSVRDAVGFDALWTHQVEAIEHLRAGRNVVVTTGTGSGKSLCYQLPVAQSLLDPIRPGTALVIGPTKALAHDQLRALEAFGFRGLKTGAYDGDASSKERTYARSRANVVFTTPEMLHGGLLPNHARWVPFLMRLRYVVIDEMHVFRGVFGSHLAQVIRRLRRVASLYGSHPGFILCSATIGEPATLASALCGLPVHPVADDGAPKGPRTIALLQPALDPRRDARVSPNSEAASLTASLAGLDHRVITFCRGRRATEVVAAEAQRRTPKHADAIRAYRAGYLPEERREIEDDLSSGALKAVVTTSALELGIDVGALDACVINGFPGTIASTWQQIGRVGRTGQPSLGVLIAGDDQLDQWLVRNPRALFERPPEPAVINTTNPFIVRPHLACGAFERPLDHSDERWWDDDALANGVRDLVTSDLLAIRPHPRRGARGVWTGKGVPAPRVGLRSGAAGQVKIRLADGSLVGTVDAGRAADAVHPGAVYLHQGRPFDVVSLDLDGHIAVVKPSDGTTTTSTRSTVDIAVTGIEQSRRLGPINSYLGTVAVSSQIVGYQRRELLTRRVVESSPLHLPPTNLETRSFWFTFGADTLARADIDTASIGGALHAAEHAAIGMLPLFTICDRSDVGGVSIAHHPDTQSATIFIYDGYPGGAGVAELGWQRGAELLAATRDAIAQCSCEAGCPTCVQSPKCGNGNEPLDKSAAVRLLAAVLGAVVPKRTKPRTRPGFAPAA